MALPWAFVAPTVMARYEKCHGIAMNMPHGGLEGGLRRHCRHGATAAGYV